MLKSFKRVTSLMLVMLVVFTGVTPIISNATTQSLITDATLLATIHDYNGDKIISQTELDKLYYLQIWEGVKDLNGLENANYLRRIYYEYDGTDLDFSKVQLDKVTELVISISDNNNFDLEFLNKFPRLKKLEIISDYSSNVNLSQIVNYQNIKNLEIRIKDIKNLNGINQLQNLEELAIVAESTVDLTGIEKLSKLEKLSFNNVKLQNAENIGNLNNLKEIIFYSCEGVSLPSYLKNNTNLSNINFSYSDITDISFVEELNELEVIDLTSTNVTTIEALKNLPKLVRATVFDSKVTEDQRVNLMKFEDYTAYVGERKNISPTLDGIIDRENWNYTSSNEDIAIVSEDGAIQTLKAGDTTITMTNKITNDVKTMKITVKGIESNQIVGTISNSVQVTTNLVLKENGELWKIYIDEGKAEKIDTNIKKCVSDFIYTPEGQAIPYTLKIKTDGTGELEFNGVTSKIENIKDICRKGYLSTDGIYYELLPDGSWLEVTNNVEKIVDWYLVKNDGKTYDTYGQLVCNFKIIAASGTTVVDENKVVWKKSSTSVTSYKWEKIGENFKRFTDGTENSYSASYETEDGKIMDVFGKEVQYQKEVYCESNKLRLDKQNNALLNDTIILDNVNSILAIDSNNIVFIRNDGSVWTIQLEGKAKLEKIEEQAEKVFFTNDTLKTKVIVLDEHEGNIVTGEALTGFNINNLEVSNVTKNFKEEYLVKVFSNDRELTADNKIATGDIIRLYNTENELVKEYTALVYGDVTGSGSPGSKDALAIVKNKTGKVIIEKALNLEAARVTENTRKKAGEPTSSDALAIIKAKLGKYTISL